MKKDEEIIKEIFKKNYTKLFAYSARIYKDGQMRKQIIRKFFAHRVCHLSKGELQMWSRDGVRCLKSFKQFIEDDLRG